MTRENQQEAKAAGKRKPRRKNQIPVNVKSVRSGAFHHLKALDNMLLMVVGEGLMTFQAIDDADKWVGLAWNGNTPPVLLLHLDQGSRAWAMTWLIHYKLCCRFIAMRDLFHREWNDVRLALGDANSWWVVLLATIVYNVPHGPWQTKAWWQNIVGMAKDYLARAS